MGKKYHSREIEDVEEPFCGHRLSTTVTLSEACPWIADQWCYKRNAGWGPEHFSRSSNVRCWWKCPSCGREYKSRIAYRTGGGSSCPFCVGRRLCRDNALSVCYPSIAREWHPTRNGKLLPSDVSYGSNKRVWWVCGECSYEWQGRICNRTARQQKGCKACWEVRRRAHQGEPKLPYKPTVLNSNSENVSTDWQERRGFNFKPLAATHLKIANQWHPTKNGKMTSFDFSSGSGTIVWWKCKKGTDHEWQSPIFSRTQRGGSHCPFCIGKRVSVTNSLQYLFPKIAKEWHPKRNGRLKPDQVTAHSGRKIWWQCKTFSEHEWQTSIYKRTRGAGCPMCAPTHNKVSPQSCLNKDFPYIACQLHPTKNGDITGDNITAQSHKRVWWICHKGPDHIWQASPGNRTRHGTGCPYCVGRKVSVTNSLVARFPDIAKHWDKKKNERLRPDHVTAGSDKNVWWLCDAGHSWQQRVYKRTRTAGECYQCRTGKSRRQATPGERSALLSKLEEAATKSEKGHSSKKIKS